MRHRREAGHAPLAKPLPRQLSFDEVEVPRAVDSDKESRPFVPCPSFMDHLRGHIGIRTRIERHLLIIAVMLHGKRATEDGERLIRRMPVSRHMEVLRCSNDEL